MIEEYKFGDIIFSVFPWPGEKKQSIHVMYSGELITPAVMKGVVTRVLERDKGETRGVCVAWDGSASIGEVDVDRISKTTQEAKELATKEAERIAQEYARYALLCKRADMMKSEDDDGKVLIEK